MDDVGQDLFLRPRARRIIKKRPQKSERARVGYRGSVLKWIIRSLSSQQKSIVLSLIVFGGLLSRSLLEAEHCVQLIFSITVYYGEASSNKNAQYILVIIQYRIDVCNSKVLYEHNS